MIVEMRGLMQNAAEHNARDRVQIPKKDALQ